MDKYVVYHDMMEALQHGSCPVCTLVEQRIERAIKVMLREGFGDPGLRSSYLKAKGYCNHHAWQMREAGDPLAHAVMYRGLLEEHKEALELYIEGRRSRIGKSNKENAINRIRTILHNVGVGEADANVKAKAKAKATTKTKTKVKTTVETYQYLNSFSSAVRCPLCETAETCEAWYVEAVADYYEGDEEFRERYRNRGVLCHPHLRKLIETQSHRDELQELLEIQLGRLDTYIDHLYEIERQAVYSGSNEWGGAERGGWIRAVHLDVGIPGTDTSYKVRDGLRGDILIKK